MILSLQTRPVEQMAVVYIGGEVDLACADGMRGHLMAALRTAGPGLVIDLARVEFMDCAGLGALVAARGRARLMGKQLFLSAVPDRIRRIIRLGGLDDAFTFCNGAPAQERSLF
ncbi:STAS domain-containing protein [Actinomadura macra]|uniref:STAS domain-containing protein n=1 Tax=Actinomadura macra TaxID=46164 RepID=UPI0008358C74|nr:STAS domain-containing protein [Actinomadura macra]